MTGKYGSPKECFVRVVGLNEGNARILWGAILSPLVWFAVSASHMYPVFLCPTDRRTRSSEVYSNTGKTEASLEEPKAIQFANFLRIEYGHMTEAFERVPPSKRPPAYLCMSVVTVLAVPNHILTHQHEP